jgi:excinuclease ABC subunit B
VKGGVTATKYYAEPEDTAQSMAAEPIVALATREQLEKMIADTEKKMQKAAKDLDFMTAAQFRDEMLALKRQLKDKH